ARRCQGLIACLVVEDNLRADDVVHGQQQRRNQGNGNQERQAVTKRHGGVPDRRGYYALALLGTKCVDAVVVSGSEREHNRPVGRQTPTAEVPIGNPRPPSVAGYSPAAAMRGRGTDQPTTAFRYRRRGPPCPTWRPRPSRGR